MAEPKLPKHRDPDAEAEAAADKWAQKLLVSGVVASLMRDAFIAGYRAAADRMPW